MCVNLYFFVFMYLYSIMLLMGALLFLTEGSTVASFIYMFF